MSAVLITIGIIGFVAIYGILVPYLIWTAPLEEDYEEDYVDSFDNSNDDSTYTGTGANRNQYGEL